MPTSRISLPSAFLPLHSSTVVDPLVYLSHSKTSESSIDIHFPDCALKFSIYPHINFLFSLSRSSIGCEPSILSTLSLIEELRFQMPPF